MADRRTSSRAGSLQADEASHDLLWRLVPPLLPRPRLRRYKSRLASAVRCPAGRVLYDGPLARLRSRVCGVEEMADRGRRGRVEGVVEVGGGCRSCRSAGAVVQGRGDGQAGLGSPGSVRRESSRDRSKEVSDGLNRSSRRLHSFSRCLCSDSALHRHQRDPGRPPA